MADRQVIQIDVIGTGPVGPQGPQGPQGPTGDVASVAGKTGAVTLDADDVAYDYTATYASGTIGEAFSNLKTYVTPEMYGAVGDGVSDDANAINTALSNGDFVICKGDYYIASPIRIGSGKTFIALGTITALTDAIYINGYGSRIIVNEVAATNTCVKIANESSCEHNWFECYKLTGEIGISYTGESWAQYNSFHRAKMECSNYDIYISHPSDSNGWFNENFFHDMKCDGACAYGIYIENLSSNKGLLNGNKFNNVGFENDNNAIYINGCHYMVFDNCRIQEIGSNKKFIVLEGQCSYLKFSTVDFLSVKKIDIASNTGSHTQIIAPLAFNDGSGMTYHAYVDSGNITYALRQSRQLNVTSDITMDINSTTFAELPIYDVFTFRDTATKHTLKLSPQYGVKGINMIKLYVASGVSVLIKDSSDHTVFNKDNATAGSYIFVSDGTGYWLGGRLQ